MQIVVIDLTAESCDGLGRIRTDGDSTAHSALTKIRKLLFVIGLTLLGSSAQLGRGDHQHIIDEYCAKNGLFVVDVMRQCSFE
jgi:hypothetical protein